MGELSGKHIVVVPAWWPSPEQPHAGVFFQDYVDAFAAAGADVGVIFPDLVGLRELGRGVRKPIVPHIMHEKCGSDHANVVRIRGLQSSFGSVARRARRFCDWLARGLIAYRERCGEPDILHAMCAVPAGWACTHLDDGLAKRVVLTEHTGPFSLAMEPPESAELARGAFESAVVRLAVSHALRGQIWDAGIRGAIEVCGNPVPEMFSPGDVASRSERDRVRGLFVGRLVEQKGLRELGLAVESVRKREIDAEFHLVGEGDFMLTAALRAYDIGTAGTFSCMPACSRDEVVAHMRDADFLVHPSWGESFGMTVAEALCTGLPVVTTRGTACADFIDDDNGILVEPRDAPSLEAGLLKMIETCRNYDRAGIAARARERFSGAAVAAAYNDVFERVLDAD